MARKRIKTVSSGRKVDPRTGRKTVYLGHRVPDTGKPGLDNPGEVRGITREIVKDYKSGRIDRRTAMSRLNLLKLIVKKDKDFRGKRKAYKYIESAKAEIKSSPKRSKSSKRGKRK